MMHQGCLNSDVYQMRLNYIDFVIGMSLCCSSKFFLLNKFHKVLELAEDRVFDVRLKLSKNLFIVRTMIDDQDDHTLTQLK
jgi:serine/threonine-protein phosphatase 4 regulatory subunit 4